jgi:hypothetical protein
MVFVRKYLYANVLWIAIICFCNQSIIGQSDTSAPDSIYISTDSTKTITEKVPKEKIDAFRQNKDFDYTTDRIKGFSLLPRFLYWLDEILDAIFSNKGAAPYLRVFIVFLVLAFLIYKIAGANISLIFSKNRKAKKDNGFGYFDEDIHVQDLDSKLDMAIAGQNFRDAIRYYYLKLLKTLDSNELIKWEISKTNMEYLKELMDHPVRQDFRSLSGIYEYTWYGNFSVDAMHFTNWQSGFQAAIQLANQK